MSSTITQIVERLLEDESITAEEAVILLKAEISSQNITYIPYSPPYNPYNPPIITQPDWTYDPNRPGQPYWGGINSTNTENE